MKESFDALTHYSFLKEDATLVNEFNLLVLEGSHIVLGGWDLKDAYRQMSLKAKFQKMNSAETLFNGIASRSATGSDRRSENGSAGGSAGSLSGRLSGNLSGSLSGMSNVLFACGLHPWSLLRLEDSIGMRPKTPTETPPETNFESRIEIELQLLEKLIPDFDMVGEIGIDTSILSHLSTTSEVYKFYLEKQISIFQKQLHWARKLLKPSILHVVRGHRLVLDIIGSDARGYVHGFSGSIETARDYIRRGLYLSVGRQILNPKNMKLRRAITAMDLNYLLLESDFPHSPLKVSYGLLGLSGTQSSQESEVSVRPFELRRSNLLEIASQVAQLRNLSTETIVRIGHENFIRMMGNF